MRLNVSGRNIDITDHLREHISNRARKLKRFFDGIIDVNVTLSVDHSRHLAEVILNAPPQATIIAQGQSNNMYESIDRAMEKAERQVAKHKDRLRKHHKKAERREQEGAV